MKNCSAMFGLSDSIVLMNLRAHSSVAAKRTANFLSSVAWELPHWNVVQVGKTGKGSLLFLVSQVYEEFDCCRGPRFGTCSVSALSAVSLRSPANLGRLGHSWSGFHSPGSASFTSSTCQLTSISDSILTEMDTSSRSSFCTSGGYEAT
jgi:hypothetical protein